MVSMWNRLARYLRVWDAAGFVAMTVGNTTASVPPSSRRVLSARTMNAFAEPESRAAPLYGCPAIISFSRRLIACSSSLLNWSWRRLSRVKGGFMITRSIGGGDSAIPCSLSTC